MVPLSQDLFLQPALDRLRVAVLEQNRPGSVEGLLAHHVLKDDPRIRVDWQVLCTSDWASTQFQPTNLDHVAALGYSSWAQPAPLFTDRLLDGLARVRERDAFKGQHLSIARNPTRLLGIILGCLALGTDAVETLQWCRDVLQKMQQKEMADFDPLVGYLGFRACGTRIPLAPSTETDLYRLAFADWAFRHQMHQTEPSQQQRDQQHRSILYQAATALHFESVSQAAFIWTSISSILFHALAAAAVQPRDVAAVLQNFEPALKRWRWDSDDLQKPIRWPITQEREVQDILWLILRSYFPDVVDEDALPKLGHSTYKADFGIGSLKLIIEAKFASGKGDFKKIEKEVQEDCIPYLRDLRYESLIVFIYDDSASVQEHDTTRRALLEIPGVIEVVIVSRPSQLPATTATPPAVAPGRKRRQVLSSAQ